LINVTFHVFVRKGESRDVEIIMKVLTVLERGRALGSLFFDSMKDVGGELGPSPDHFDFTSLQIT
jgi:hypothetical protein